MLEFLSRLFDTEDFPPRAICGNWTDNEIRLHNWSDFVTALSYISIPAILLIIARKRRKERFYTLLTLFAAFILWCGLTHICDILVFYWPAYRLFGVVKLITAVISTTAVLVLAPNMKNLLAAKTPEELEKALALQRGEYELMASLVESSGHALHVKDINGTIRTWNKAAAELFGYSSDEAIGHNIRELVVPADRREEHQHFMERLRAGEEIRDYETERVTKNGARKWVNLTLAPIVNNGVVVGASVIQSDVTARKLTERRLKLLLDSTTSIFWNTNAEGAVQATMPSWEAYTRQTFEQYKGFGWKDAVHVADLPPLMEKWQDVLRQSPDTFAIDGFRLWCSQKQQHRYCRFHGVAIRGGDNKVIEWVGAIIDEHERKSAEYALSQSERQLRAIYQQAPVGISEVDLNGKFIAVNPGYCEIVGYNQQELLTKSSQDITHGQDVGMDTDLFEQVKKGQMPFYRVEKRYIHKDGRVVWVELRGVVVRDDHNEPICGLAIVQDITARKASEEAMLQESQRKDEFIAMLSHELRNPLAPCLTALYLLRNASADLETRQNAYSMLDRQIRNLSRMVDDLLDVARIRGGKIRLRKEKVDMRTIVRVVCDNLKESVATRKHHLQLECGSSHHPLWVAGDSTRLEQVLTNIITNSIKYTEPGGKITVRTMRDNEWVVIRVKDTGIGIAPDVLPHIFDLFTQSSRSLDRAQGGLGIGLTLARNLVTLHGGTIETFSEGLGLGSEFTIKLPYLAREIKQAEQETGKVDRSKTGGKVLVVDDNVDATESLRMMLKMCGYTVETAYDGQAAMEKMKRFKPDVALLDIGLPGMDGYALAKAIRTDDEIKDTLLVACTGYGQEQDIERSAAAGFDHHLVKPIDPASIERLLSRHFDE